MAARRSQTGRADLLRALALQGPKVDFGLDSGDRWWFGFVLRPEQASVPGPASEEAGQTVPPSAPPASPAPVHRPLQMPQIWAVVERHDLHADRDNERSPEQVVLEPLDEAAARAASPHPLVAHEDLVPWARLNPVLRKTLSQPKPAGLDIQQLCHLMAAQRLPQRLPRQVRSRWNPDLVVALDFSERLWPYRSDLHQLCRQLLRQCGRTGLSLRVMAHGAFGGWTDWLTESGLSAQAPHSEDWRMPLPGARILIVSDLGLLAHEPGSRVEWRCFIRQAQAKGVLVQALVPLGDDQLDPATCSLLPIYRWCPDSRFRAEHGNVNAAGAGDVLGLAELLALVAATRRVDPPLLRALRKLNKAAPGNAGLEGAVWSHADVEPGLACTVRPQAAPGHLSRFEALAPGLQTEQREVCRHHHAHLRAALTHEEVLLHAAHSHETAVSHAAVANAAQFFMRLASTLASPTDLGAATWSRVADDVIRRADTAMAARFSRVLTPLLARHPQGEDPAVSPASPASPYWLVEDSASRTILLQPHAPSVGQVQLGSLAHAGRVIVETESSDRRLLSLAGSTHRIAAVAGRLPLTLGTHRERLVLAPVRRPRGVQGWRVHRAVGSDPVVTLVLPSLTGGDDNETPASWARPSRTDPDRRFLARDQGWEKFLPSAWPGYGVDEYGAYCDLEVKGHIQRLRYIEPGAFMMGSPLGEPWRDENEGPQHPVTLSQGFWLADTTCTQALWTAIMGGRNPSLFTGSDDLPVDSVSWKDTRAFLAKLRAVLPPGCEAVLPTEAQWEYACRAGTTKRFSGGDQIDPSWVNYNGNHPYHGGMKGEFRERTVPVKSLPANPWGLHEMHGNLWEWCTDAQRTYADQVELDPHGGTGGTIRVLRGGAWHDDARRCRSASRLGARSGLGDPLFGFRFALRSVSAGGGAAVWASEEPGTEPQVLKGPEAPQPRIGVFSRLMRKLPTFARAKK